MTRRHLPPISLDLLLCSLVMELLLPCFVFQSRNLPGCLHSSTFHQLQSLLCLFLSFTLVSIHSHLHSPSPCHQPFCLGYHHSLLTLVQVSNRARLSISQVLLNYVTTTLQGSQIFVACNRGLFPSFIGQLCLCFVSSSFGPKLKSAFYQGQRKKEIIGLPDGSHSFCLEATHLLLFLS